MEELSYILLGGIVGTISAIVTNHLSHYYEKKTIIETQKTERVIERKAEVYVKTMNLLRSIAVLSKPDAIAKLNDILDELAIWASDRVYKNIKELIKQLKESPEYNWPDVAGPILVEMVKEFRTDSKLKKVDMLPIITFRINDLPDIYDLARGHTQQNFENILNYWDESIIDEILEKYQFKKISTKSKNEKVKYISSNIYK